MDVNQWEIKFQSEIKSNNFISEIMSISGVHFEVSNYWKYCISINSLPNSIKVLKKNQFFSKHTRLYYMRKTICTGYRPGVWHCADCCTKKFCISKESGNQKWFIYYCFWKPAIVIWRFALSPYIFWEVVLGPGNIWNRVQSFF